MSTTELQSLVSGLVSSAIEYTDGELGPERAKAIDFYHGRPFGNEEAGRSQAVLTEVRDGIQAVLPPLLRVIFGNERAVEFRPDGPEDVEIAAQATDYVNYVFSEDNAGFMHTLAVLKDGLRGKIGIFKWGWDDTTQVTTHKLENLTEEQIEILASDDEIKITRIEPAGQDEAGAPLHTVELTRTRADGRVRIMAVPPEEFLHNREARSLEEALFLAHRTRKTRGELVAMGIDPKVVDAHGGDDSGLADSEEAIARTVDEAGNINEEIGGAANDKILYIEGYARIDYDGDGIAELRKICTVGGAHHIVENEPIDMAPFAIYCPDPEPHTLLGLSWADRLMDMQKIKSFLMRAGLDSLSASIHPRTWYKEGDANLADVLNTAIGAPIRTKTGQGAVGEFAHTFTGKEAFPVLQYCDDVIERRTGQNKGAQGIDADALQSSTKDAVAAVTTASQAQQEMLVRIFAEGTLKVLFRGILKLLVAHQPRARMVRLRGQFVTMDPRSWNADMDVQVNVALGAGLIEERIQTLMAIAENQGILLEKLGKDNPLVSLVEYRYTLAQIVSLRGFPNTERFYKPVSKEQLAALMQQEAQQAPQETPEMVIAKAQIQIEQMKAEAKKESDLLNAQRELLKVKAELELKRREIMLEDDRQRDKQATDAIIALRKIEADTGVSQAGAVAQIEEMRRTAQRSPEEMAPRKRRVSIERDGSGRLAGATVVDEEDM